MISKHFVLFSAALLFESKDILFSSDNFGPCLSRNFIESFIIVLVLDRVVASAEYPKASTTTEPKPNFDVSDLMAFCLIMLLQNKEVESYVQLPLSSSKSISSELQFAKI